MSSNNLFHTRLYFWDIVTKLFFSALHNEEIPLILDDSEIEDIEDDEDEDPSYQAEADTRFNGDRNDECSDDESNTSPEEDGAEENGFSTNYRGVRTRDGSIQKVRGAAVRSVRST